MFVQSNRLTDLFPYFKRKLVRIYDEREAESIFFLVCHTWFQADRLRVLHSDIRLSESDLLRFKDCVDRLLKHEPIQYILGEVEFHGLKFRTGPQALIPRPETEELVDHVVRSTDPLKSQKIIDFGTGTGCIAIALKSVLKRADVVGVDVSAQALELAMSNAERLRLEVEFLKEDILQMTQLPGWYDIIVSNPPYIPQAEKSDMSDHVKNFEPQLALFVPDHDPLIFYRRILELARNGLNTGGVIWFETHSETVADIPDLALKLGFANCKILKDLSGKNRFAKISN